MVWGWSDPKSMGSVWTTSKTMAMATVKRSQPAESRIVLANVRLTASERAHLRRVALDRCTSMSELMREALRFEGSLPAE